MFSKAGIKNESNYLYFTYSNYPRRKKKLNKNIPLYTIENIQRLKVLLLNIKHTISIITLKLFFF